MESNTLVTSAFLVVSLGLFSLWIVAVSWKFHLEKKARKQPIETTHYDIVVKIDSVLSTERGWEVVASRPEKFFQVQGDEISDKEISEVMVCALGLFNTGKTWFLNTLFRSNFASDELIRTEGLSIVCPDTIEGNNITMLDTVGSDEAVKQGLYLETRITEAFLREISIQLSNVVCIVVNRLHSSDQAYIVAAVELIKKKSGDTRVIIVHNLSNTTTDSAVETVISTDIKGAFEAKEMEMAVGEEKCPYFISSCSSVEIEHFVFARQDSEASRRWNRLSRLAIVNILQCARSKGRKLKLLSEICEFSSNRLPQLLTGASDFQILPKMVEGKMLLKEIQYSSKGSTSSSSTKTERRLSETIMVTDGGNLFGVNLPANSKEVWCPKVTNLEYDDRFVVILEMAGFDECDMEFIPRSKQVHGAGEIQSILVRSKGPRKIVLGEERARVTWENQIPSGRSEVEISIPIRVKLSKHKHIKVERREGIWFITLKRDRIQFAPEDRFEDGN